MTLSNSKLKSLLNKSNDKRTELADRDGLGGRIKTNGTITFQYRYRFNNKPMRLTLGRFPDLTLSQARDKIPPMRQMLWEGKNPSKELKK